MKKLLIGIVLSLICTPIFACHFFNDSYICGTTAYMHGEFSAYSKFQFRFYGADTTIIKEFETDSLIIDSTIKFQIPAGTTDVKLQFRNYYIYQGQVYNNWAGNYDAGDYFEVDSVSTACHLLAVTLSNLQTLKNNNNLNVSFNAGDETNIKEYNILASSDGREYNKIGKAIKATGANNYSQSIDLRDVVAFLPFLLIGTYNEEKKKKVYNKTKKWLTFILYVSVIFIFSCNKIKDVISKPPVIYTSVKIQTVNNDGGLSYSETQPIRN